SSARASSACHRRSSRSLAPLVWRRMPSRRWRSDSWCSALRTDGAAVARAGLPWQVFALAGTCGLAAYGVAALAIGLIVLCFAEVGSRFGATGGPYLYTRVAFGPLIGFQVGWLMWIARLTGFASLTNLFVAYLALFVPGVGTGVPRILIIALIVAILSIVNIVGVRASATVTNVLTAGKLIPLFLLAAAGLFFVDPQRYSLAVAPAYGSFSKATLLLVFAYMGFEGAVIPSGEMRHPQRQLAFC